jgi:hypothetical protein
MKRVFVTLSASAPSTVDTLFKMCLHVENLDYYNILFVRPIIAIIIFVYIEGEHDVKCVILKIITIIFTLILCSCTTLE